jgi:hypothetical protein
VRAFARAWVCSFVLIKRHHLGHNHSQTQIARTSDLCLLPTGYPPQVFGFLSQLLNTALMVILINMNLGLVTNDDTVFSGEQCAVRRAECAELSAQS